jgi:hypothetical protein
VRRVWGGRGPERVEQEQGGAVISVLGITSRSADRSHAPLLLREPARPVTWQALPK